MGSVWEGRAFLLSDLLLTHRVLQSWKRIGGAAEAAVQRVVKVGESKVNEGGMFATGGRRRHTPTG